MDSDHPMHHPFHIHGAGRFRWMAHCHIAEHHESGMMFSFDVDPAAGQTVGSA
jgi:FtsP/CotA-like multicopper oxidase with cupredoxin domain